METWKAFFLYGVFVTKVKNRMADETLDALITMKKFY